MSIRSKQGKVIETGITILDWIFAQDEVLLRGLNGENSHMSSPELLETAQGRRIAYHRAIGDGPGIVFLGGFRSDMEGTKALHLETWSKQQGRAFVRFDYSGHGTSSGAFEDGCIGDWAEDAAEIINHLCEGPQILVGSSMGGWISLLLAKRLPDKISGFVGIATAPDFTEDGFWKGFSEPARETLLEFGHLSVPSEYGEPLVVTKKLIEDGRSQLVLREPLHLGFPTRFLLGTEDEDVSVESALQLLNHVTGDDISLTLVKGVDHRFSTPECLAIIESAISDALGKI